MKKDSNQNKEIMSKLLRLFNYMFKVNKLNAISSLTFYVILIIQTVQCFSYLFNPIIVEDWGILSSSVNNILDKIQYARISPLYNAVTFDLYLIIYYISCAMTGVFTMLLTGEILLSKEKETYDFKKSMFTNSFTIICFAFQNILYIPLTELILVIFKCDSYTNLIDGPLCFEDVMIAIRFFGIIALILLNFSCHFSNMIRFDLLNKRENTTRLSTKQDMLMLFMSFTLITTNMFCNYKMFNLTIWSLGMGLVLLISLKTKTYNLFHLELASIFQKAILFYAYLSLLVKNLFIELDFKMGGLLFILPLITVLIIVTTLTIKKYKFEFNKFNSLFSQTVEIRDELYNFEELAQVFIKSKGYQYEKESKILLESYLIFHDELCKDKECFLNNINAELNWEAKKSKILYYLGDLYIKTLSYYPRDVILNVKYIYFCLEKKINLNSAKSILQYLTSLSLYIQRTDLQESYIKDFMLTPYESYLVFYLNQINNSPNEMIGHDFVDNISEAAINVNGNQNLNKLQNYDRLTNLVENTTKIYIDIFSIFTYTLQESINIEKLFTLSKTAENNTIEIKKIWGNLVKDKVNDEEKSVLELFYNFSNEILYDKNLSKEINQVLGNELLKNIDDTGEYFNLKNLDIVLENQEMVLFSRITDKGEGMILKASNSIAGILGYSNSELPNKNIEIIIPSLFRMNHATMLSKKVSVFNNKNSNSKAITLPTNNLTLFALSKSKYIIPIKQQFLVKKDQEISNSFVVKSKFDRVGGKNDFSYHILTNSNFVITNISSTCINLGLNIDLIDQQEISLKSILLDPSGAQIDLDTQYARFEETKDVIFYFNPNNHSKKKHNTASNITNKRKLSLFVKRYSYPNLNNLVAFYFCFNEVKDKMADMINNNCFQTHGKAIVNIGICNKRILSYKLASLSYKIIEITNNKNKLSSTAAEGFEDRNKSKKKISLLERIMAKKKLKTVINKDQSPTAEKLIESNSPLPSEDENQNKLNLVTDPYDDELNDIVNPLNNSQDKNVFNIIKNAKKEEPTPTDKDTDSDDSIEFTPNKKPLIFKGNEYHKNKQADLLNSEKHNFLNKAEDQDISHLESEQLSTIENKNNNELNANALENLKGEHFIKIKDVIKNLKCYSDNIVFMKRDHKLLLTEDFHEVENTLLTNTEEYITKINNLMQMERQSQEENSSVATSKNLLNYESKHDSDKLLSYLFPFNIKIGIKIYIVFCILLIFGLSIITLIQILNDAKNMESMAIAYISAYNTIFYSIYCQFLMNKINNLGKLSLMLQNIIETNTDVVNNYVWTGDLNNFNIAPLWQESGKLSPSNAKLMKDNLIDYIINIKIQKLRDIINELNLCFNDLKAYKVYLDNDESEIIKYIVYKQERDFFQSRDASTEISIYQYYSNVITEVSSILTNVSQLQNDEILPFLETLKYNNMNEPFLNMLKILNTATKNMISSLENNSASFILFLVNISVSVIIILIGHFLISFTVSSKERVVDILFTLEKTIFNKFKTASENFLNKLLQKLYMKNEQDEEVAITFIVKEIDLDVKKCK